MYILVEKNQQTGNYDVTPNAAPSTPTLADMPPMGAEITSYDNVYVFLGFQEQAQQLDENDNVSLWMDADGYYDSVNKTYFASNYDDLFYLGDGYYIRSGDKVYATGGNDQFTPIDSYDIIESDVIVKLNGTVLSEGETTYHGGDALTFEAVSGKTCGYVFAGIEGFNSLNTTETRTLDGTNYTVYPVIVMSKDETNMTIGLAKYVLRLGQ